MKVRAAVVDTPGAVFRLAELELEPPRADEVMVRLEASGICHTDLKARARQPDTEEVFEPIVYGHEGAGVVEAVGQQVTSVRIGDRVCVSYLSCGSCRRCQGGAPYYCDDLGELNFSGRRPDGSTALQSSAGEAVRSRFFGQSSFATACLAHERNVVPVPDSVPLEVAAPFGCGVQTGAGTVLRALRPPPGASLAVFGAGAVGLSAVLAAVVAGCGTIIAFDRVQTRLQLAASLGATHVLHPSDGDVVDAMAAITAGDGVDYCIDTTGAAAVFESAFATLAPQGTLAFVASADHPTVDWGRLMVGRCVRGIIEGESRPQELLPTLFDLWSQGRFPIDRIMKSYAFDDIERAAADSASGATVKPVLKIAV